MGSTPAWGPWTLLIGKTQRQLPAGNGNVDIWKVPPLELGFDSRREFPLVRVNRAEGQMMTWFRRFKHLRLRLRRRSAVVADKSIHEFRNFLNDAEKASSWNQKGHDSSKRWFTFGKLCNEAQNLPIKRNENRQHLLKEKDPLKRQSSAFKQRIVLSATTASIRNRLFQHTNWSSVPNPSQTT